MTDTDTRSPAARLRALAASAISVRRLQQRADRAEQLGCCPPTGLRKEYRRCPMCECITEMVAMYALWYPTIDMCCRCGDSWSEGELHERPFRRGWRTEAIRRYRRLWDEATFGPPPTLAELEGDTHA